MNIRLSKVQLDKFSTFIGLAIAIVAAAIQFEFLPAREGGFAQAVLLAVLGFLTNKPASATPTTAQVERKNVENS